MTKRVDVSLTEEAVLNYSALPSELEGWRYYRIEYGGCNEACFMERSVMLPPRADAYIIYLLFDFWQTDVKRKRLSKLCEIIKELENSL